MIFRGPTLSPDRAATLGTAALLLAGAAALASIDPTAALAWLGSTALMTGRFP